MGKKTDTNESNKRKRCWVVVFWDGNGVFLNYENATCSVLDPLAESYSDSHQKQMQPKKVVKIASQVNTVRRWGLLGH